MGDLTGKAGALLVAGALALAACTKVDNGAALTAHGLPGVVRIVGIGSIDSLIPMLSGNEGAADIAAFWGAWLFRVDERGELVPELATEVPTQANGGISRDGLTITYHLRRGVKWHDGAPFTARDVIFTWHAIMNPRNNVLTRSGYDAIASMSAPDDYTLKVTLRRPYAPAVATYFGPSSDPFCILPQHLLGKLSDINRAAYDSNPIGTGPFVLAQYEPGIKVKLLANPSYWRGEPKLKEVDFLIVPDLNTRTLMMRTGEADVYYQAADNKVAELQSIPGVRVIDRRFNEFWYLAFNARNPPLDDVRVRRAIAMAVDREYVIKAVANGLGTPADGDQPDFSWAYDRSVRAPRFDPAGAGELLGAAGWRLSSDGFRYKDGTRLTLQYVTSKTYGEAYKFGPVFQVQMKRIGVDVQVKFYPTSLLYAAKETGGIMNNGKFDVAWVGWIGGVDPDDDTLWACDQMPPNGYNYQYFCDPRIDQQERIALTLYGLAQRRAAYSRIQQLLAEDVPVHFLFWTHVHNAVSVRLQGFRSAPTVTVFMNPWEWRI